MNYEKSEYNIESLMNVHRERFTEYKTILNTMRMHSGMYLNID